MTSFLRLPLLPLLALAYACGGAVTSPPPSGGAPSDAGNDTGSTSPPPACSGTLDVGPVQLVSAPGDSDRLQALTSSGHGGLVGWIATSGAQTAQLLVRPVGLDGAPTAAAQSVMTAQATASLAQGLGRAAALAPDATPSCQLQLLNGDGTTSGAAVPLGAGGCESLRVTPGGFDLILFSSNPYAMSLVTTDPTGASAATTVLENTGLPVASLGRASFTDGSFLVAAEPESLDNCVCPVTLSAHHFSAGGASLAAAVDVGPIYPGSHIALAGMGSSALLATTGSIAGPVSVRELDEDGHTVGSAQPLGTPLDGGGPQVLGIDITPFGSGALVAWIEILSSETDARMLVQAVSSTGAPQGSPVIVAPTGVGRDVRLVATASGALVAWDGPLVTAQPDGTVSVAALKCAP